jgi:DNA-binding ferritin-like protein
LREHVDDIAERVTQLGGEAEGTIKMVVRDAIDPSSSAGDEVTVDSFVGARRAIDSLLWMVRAHGTEPRSAQPKHAPPERKRETSARPRH